MGGGDNVGFEWRSYRVNDNLPGRLEGGGAAGFAQTKGKHFT